MAILIALLQPGKPWKKWERNMEFHWYVRCTTNTESNVHPKSGIKKPFPLEDQMKADLTDCVTTDSGFLENQIGFLGTHCGYVDQELFPVTTYTMIRTMDLAAVTGERFKNWLKENNVELISYRDLKG